MPGWFEREEQPGCFRRELAPLLGPCHARHVPMGLMWPNSLRACTATSGKGTFAGHREGTLGKLQDDDPEHLHADGDVALTLTATPEAQVAVGLVHAIAEARKAGEGGLQRDGLHRIVRAAQAELERTKAEYRRCSTERVARLEAFEGCEPIQRLIDRLYAAASHPPASTGTTTGTTTGAAAATSASGASSGASSGSSAATTFAAACGPRRANFLDLHLSLVREGFFRRPSISASAGVAPPLGARQTSPPPFAYPFCWLPPKYVLFLGGLWPVPRLADGTEDEGDEEDSEDSEDDGDHHHVARRESSREVHSPYSIRSRDLMRGFISMQSEVHSPYSIRPWDQGIRLWRELVRLGHVSEGLLTRRALSHAVFELADGHVQHEIMTVTGGTPIPTGGTASSTLEAYYAFVRRMVKAVMHVGGGVPVPVDHATEAPATAPSMPSAPVSEGMRSLAKTPRLRHTWPPADGHLAEVMRKLGLLRAAISSHDGALTRAATLKEWRSYGRRARHEEATKLSLTRLHRALREMPGIDYAGMTNPNLTFRYAAVMRAAPGNLLQRAARRSQALLDARRLDVEEWLCFLRWLDQDCDGLVSADDYINAVLQPPQRQASQADLKTILSEKWHKASLMLESLRRREAGREKVSALDWL